MNEDSGDEKEGIDGWKTHGRGGKLTGFDNCEYEILHKSVYRSYLVLLRVVKIVDHLSLMLRRKTDFIPIESSLSDTQRPVLTGLCAAGEYHRAWHFQHLPPTKCKP